MTQRQPSEATCRALCKALDEQVGVPEDLCANVQKALAAYRAESTPLRTRAEVDADKMNLADMLYRGGCDYKYFLERMSELCAEPTAPEPAAEGEQKPACSVCGDKGYTDDCNCEYVHSCKVCPIGAKWAKGIPMRNENHRSLAHLTDHGADTREAERKRPPIKDCDWCQDDSGVPLRSHRIPASTVMICQRCRYERGITE